VRTDLFGNVFGTNSQIRSSVDTGSESKLAEDFEVFQWAAFYATIELATRSRYNMTTYFVSGHRGAVEWAKRQVQFDQATFIGHLDESSLFTTGDRVCGTLPIQLAADIVAGGVQYWHLELKVSPETRRTELSADDMVRHGARLVRYHIEVIEDERDL
jgi:putative CRISPR-associated protein (TIGR02620 family)